MAAWVTQYSLDGIDVDYEVGATRSALFPVSNEDS